jgi:hypothetical protein
VAYGRPALAYLLPCRFNRLAAHCVGAGTRNGTEWHSARNRREKRCCVRQVDGWWVVDRAVAPRRGSKSGNGRLAEIRQSAGSIGRWRGSCQKSQPPYQHSQPAIMSYSRHRDALSGAYDVPAWTTPVPSTMAARTIPAPLNLSGPPNASRGH